MNSTLLLDEARGATFQRAPPVKLRRVGVHGADAATEVSGGRRRPRRGIGVSCDLAAKVKFLSSPEVYVPPVRAVAAKETHMSWVFLAGKFAYKLKKPARTHWLDYSTPAARYRAGCEELRLNRRFAPEIYRGLVRLGVTPGGELKLAGGAQTVDWLVKMRRLPASRMLDRAIAEGRASREDARRVSAMLAVFYARQPPAKITSRAYRDFLAAEIASSADELRRPAHGLPIGTVNTIVARQRAYLQREAAVLTQRVERGRVIEAHGDLRPEHICLLTRPVAIDGLEFSRTLRTLDVISELAFFRLECERLGGPEFGRLVLKTCSALLGDAAPRHLVAFYRSWHALVRAKVAAWHVHDHRINDHAKWLEKAACYLRLAARASRDALAWSRSATT